MIPASVWTRAAPAPIASYPLSSPQRFAFEKDTYPQNVWFWHFFNGRTVARFAGHQFKTAFGIGLAERKRPFFRRERDRQTGDRFPFVLHDPFDGDGCRGITGRTAAGH